MLVPGVACLNSNPRQNPHVDVVYLLQSVALVLRFLFERVSV